MKVCALVVIQQMVGKWKAICLCRWHDLQFICSPSDTVHRLAWYSYGRCHQQFTLLQNHRQRDSR